jgi:hypothetical protein
VESEFREALLRLLVLIAGHLVSRREAGDGAQADELRGVAIQQSEAEELIAALVVDLDEDDTPPPPQPSPQAPPPDAAARARATPLARAARVFRMLPLDAGALALALAVEADGRFARLVAFLNDHVAQTRPTVGLAVALFGGDASRLCASDAVRLGLLQLLGDGPLPTRALRVAPEFLRRLSETALDETESSGAWRPAHPGRLDELVLEAPMRASLRRWAEALAAGAAPPLVLAGSEGAGRAAAAHAALSTVGLGLYSTVWTPGSGGLESLAQAGREALWRDAVLLVRVPSDPRDCDFAALWSALAHWRAPVVLALAPALAEAACAAAPVEPLLLRLAPPTLAERAALWRQLLRAQPGARVDEADLAELAARYEFAPGTMARALRRAARETGVATGAKGALDLTALARACRAVGSAGMTAIAQRLDLPFTRDHLVLPRALLDELDLAGCWIRNRLQVFENWGFARRVTLGRGLTALFCGEPGTGKTMAAQVLARELGLDLFRVDLSRVMSKYIGETEKNLSALFDDARASGAMLFFDEAECLFNKRTDVKDAHDRYANLEVGFLLQKLEEHPGATVLATNRGGDLDKAFIRRFHFILEFPLPREEERRRIWAGMLPAEAERDAGLDLEMLARDYEISGGEIRNSVLTAAFLAAGEGAPIGQRHLKRGLRRELLKSGRVLDARRRLALEDD